jgi:hypothetical protein
MQAEDGRKWAVRLATAALYLPFFLGEDKDGLNIQERLEAVKKEADEEVTRELKWCLKKLRDSLCLYKRIVRLMRFMTWNGPVQSCILYSFSVTTMCQLFRCSPTDSSLIGMMSHARNISHYISKRRM